VLLSKRSPRPTPRTGAGCRTSSGSSFRRSLEPGTEHTLFWHHLWYWFWMRFHAAALTHSFARGIPFLRRLKALISPKNVLYMEKMDRNDVALGALPIREPYFSVAEFPGAQLRGREIHA